MNTMPVAFGDLCASGIENFKTAFERFKAHVLNVLLLALPAGIANFVGMLILAAFGIIGVGMLQLVIGIGVGLIAMLVMLMTFIVLGQLLLNLVLSVTIGLIPVLGQLAIAMFMPMSCVYLIFVLWACYRDSCATTNG